MNDSATTTMPAGFEALLFNNVDPQDLAAVPPDARAALAGSAWQHLAAPRPPGQPALHLTDHTIAGRDITDLEAINDNRPFLLDSTLAELAEQGHEPALVAHPILAVTRDAAGHLVRARPEAEDVPLEIRLFRPRGRQSPAVSALWESASR